jgi:hypothetical protein
MAKSKSYKFMGVNDAFLKPLMYSLIFALILSSCKYTTPPEMLFGNWYVKSLKANGHEMLNEYMDENTRYFTLNEEGVYRIGLLDSSNEKSWMMKSDKNEVVFLDGTPFDDIKTWRVKASDNEVHLSDKNGHFEMLLNRRQNLPEISISDETALMGKWVVDKVTINGYNNTDKYAYPNRWIVLADNGRFYNGNKEGDQNVGFWKTNSSFTKLDFFDTQTSENSFISFNIANEQLWYQKQNDDLSKPQVRIYFKKAL